MSPLLRACALVLACLPTASAAPAPSGSGTYAGVIQAWKDQDALNPPPTDAVLFLGSSSFRLWEGLARGFDDYNVIQRGFGGAEMCDLNAYIGDVVLPYDPDVIVLYAGSNDIVTGTTPAMHVDQLASFISQVHAGQNQSKPPTPIVYVGLTPTLAKWADWATIDQVNQLVSSFAASNPSLHYVDTPPLFLATGSPPAAYLFTTDENHLSPAGYAIWEAEIRATLLGLKAPDKSYVSNPTHPPLGSRLLFDFGPNDGVDGNDVSSPDPLGQHWNNWHSGFANAKVLPGQSLGNLVDTGGNGTGIDLVVTGGFSMLGINSGGLLAPSPALLGRFAIEQATQDYFYATCPELVSESIPRDPARPVQDRAGGSPGTPATEGTIIEDYDGSGGFVLTGLDRSIAYDLTFLASRDQIDFRETTFLVHGARTWQAAVVSSGNGVGTGGGNGNDDTLVQVRQARPDAYGQLYVDLRNTVGAYAHLNAMEILVARRLVKLRSNPQQRP